MFKKIILASAILATSVGVAAASTAPAPYVGASIGITNNTINTSGGLVGSATLGSYRGVPLSLFAGYGGVVSSSFYLAGEFNATVATANISDNNGLKSSYGYGVSLIPGVMVNESTLAYGRIGVVRTHFGDLPSSNRTGAEFGLGLQTSVTQNIDIRGEYDFIAYQSKSMPGVPFTLYTSAAPRQDQFSVGLVYKIS